MNPERLLQNFDRLIDTPDAVPRLRRFILDLAVRGKLVEQKPEDEPAGELLKRIEREKARLIKKGAIKELKPLSPIEDAAFPFDVPDGWKWTRLGDSVNNHFGGGTPSKNKSIYWDGDIFWASVKDIGKTKYVDKTIDLITKTGLENSSSNLIPPGNLIVVTRMGLGKVSINRVPIAINQDLRALILSSFASIDFYYIFFKTASYEGSGLTVKGIKVEELLNFPFPLPPLAEQHRIVAKVDELMKLCDELEATQAKRERRRDRLVAATLHGLNGIQANNVSFPLVGNPSEERLRTSRSDIIFEDSARFYFNHLPSLTTRPEHIQQLRKTILNLAVRGKLVPQDPKDEPVRDLLQRIDQERVRVANEDKRAAAELQDLLADELCWDVPPTWNWRGVADLALFIDYRGKTPAKVTSGIRLLTAKNVRRGFIKLEPEEFVTESTYKSWMTRGLPHKGDILFTTEAPMGNAAVVRLQEIFGLAQRVINLRPYGGLDSDFLVLQFLSKPFQMILDETATGLTAKGIKAAKLKRLPLTVPPLAEQHRIVAKVDELMKLCGELETRINTTTTTSRKLLEATLQEAL